MLCDVVLPGNIIFEKKQGDIYSALTYRRDSFSQQLRNHVVLTIQRHMLHLILRWVYPLR